MKKYLLALAIMFCLQILHAQVTDPTQVAKQDATDHANNDVNNSINNGLNNAESKLKGLFKKKSKTPAKTDSTQIKAAADSTAAANAAASAAASSATPATVVSGGTSAGGFTALSSYQNYDFVPGDTVLFEDEFTDDQSGEFPSHWDLKAGQATLNMQGTDKAFFLTDGNYCRVLPLMKNKSYLTDNFSIEYDLFANGGYTPLIAIYNADGSAEIDIHVTGSVAEYTGVTSLSGNIPADISNNNFDNKWHHIAIAFRNDQMKVYCDKYRVLTVPHCGGFKPANLQVAGIGDQSKPIIFKNFRIASNVQMFMLGQKFTDAKIVTHGINFDVDKATIKPESMGTLNMIVNVMKGNPDLKFEVDGHTDNTGTSDHNMTLSQQRAQAVMTQLVSMGIDASRLTAKGFGDTKPIADNATLEGKANNRRVEFVKQ